MTVDGEYLSYADNGSGDVGLYVGKNIMYGGRYFEVEISSMGQRGTIAIGLVPRDYPDNQQPGWGKGSLGYHADDGRLYQESGSGVNFGPKCNVGDRIGCGITHFNLGWGTDFMVRFTRNGKGIGDHNCFWGPLFPAVGMHSVGEKVKVIMDAEMPRM